MTHTYNITGMTCNSCPAKVENLLSKIDWVTTVKAYWQKGEVEITMQKHISTPELQHALRDTKYKLSKKHDSIPHIMEEEPKHWPQTYKPVLLIFAFITGISFLAQFNSEGFSWMLWMNHFMAGFFLTFSFFKLLNLQGFADSYSTYDIIAKHWRGYGFLYVFIELAVGLSYLTGLKPTLTNAVTFVVMSVSLIGVLESVLNKKKIRCACLGDVFNLPMTTITVIEDALMIAMSLVMLIYLNL